MASSLPTHTHDDTAPHTHSHPNGHGFDPATHGHTHEILSGPGSYTAREMPLMEGRDWKERAFTVGIGGYVFYPPLLPCTGRKAMRRKRATREHER